ncbi:hypothetical protein ACFE04_027037 [Oxalis oulophora]
MAKRSDFAQKLLDDLRLRKERMTTTSQSSKGSTSFPGGDAYSYAKHAHRGTGNMQAYKSSNAQVRSSGSKKLITAQEAANQIVPYGNGHSSMALAFAFENGGKLKVMDSTGNGSVISFLKQFGSKKPMSDFSKNVNASSLDIRSSSNRFPTLTHVQMKEISKGAQKLHQILKACSNGTDIDSYSIEIGKELLKGAMDLEESLRMLVNLQEASDNMSSTRSKNRITLLDEDEDNDGDVSTTQIIDKKQLELPKFSFDKRTRNSKTDFSVGNKALVTLNSVSHRRSSSSISNFATFSDQDRSVSSRSKSEKARIPCVVAKLMGIDELPENSDSKQVSHKQTNSNKKPEALVSMKAGQANTKNIGNRTEDRKPLWKDFEGTKPVTVPLKVIDIVDKQQSYINKFIRSKESQNDTHEKEGKQDSSKLSERDCRKKSETEMNKQQQLSKHTRRKSETAAEFNEKRWSKVNDSQTERRYSNKFDAGSQKKSQNGHRMQQKPEPRREFHQAEQKKQKVPEALSKDLSKPMYDVVNFRMKQPATNQVLTVRKSCEVQFEKLANSRNHDSNPVKVQTEPPKINKVVPAELDEKLVQKTKYAKVHIIETNRRIDDVIARKKETMQRGIRSPKRWNSNLPEMKQKMLENKFIVSKEAEKLMVSRPKDVEACIVNVPPITVIKKPKKEAEQALNLYHPMESQFQLPEEPRVLVQNGNFEDIISKDTNDQQVQKSKFSTKQDLSRDEGLDKESKNISYPRLMKHYEYSKPKTPKPLTENELHLKRILIQSQLFLNTAEALFKLNIPIAILQYNGHAWHDQESKLILDCSYEVMRRKRRTLELINVHHYGKKALAAKISCLDELVRQLNVEFEKLKLYGRNGNAECCVEDYLPEMIESDVCNKEADVNCMWDIGWDDLKFGGVENDEVVKSLEKVMINALIDEITRDLVLQCI